MRRPPLLLPITAIFAGGCALRPWTPSATLAASAQDVPIGTASTLPSFGDVTARWQLPPRNPWLPFEKMTLFASLDTVPEAAVLPDITQLEVVAKAEDAARSVAAAGLPNDTLWVVDLRGAASVAFGTALSHRAKTGVALVPTFNNWPADEELIPAEETLASLVRFAPKLPADDDIVARPVFLLDSWRLAYRFDEPDDDTIDNRYALNASDLPSGSYLRSRGIRRVVYVVENLDDTETEEDDLHGSFMDWSGSGISIAMMDLDLLRRDIPSEERFAEVFADEVYVPEERTTILDDPTFYVRAHAGFGIHPGGGFGHGSGFGRGGFGHGSWGGGGG